MTVSDATIYISAKICGAKETYTIRRWVDFDDLEVYGPHTTTNLEDITCNQWGSSA
jgi:hypothetical protein